MVSPAQASEDFTGADGTALPTHNASWTECEGSFSLSSNAVICDGAGASLFACAGWNGRAFSADQFSEAVVASTNAAQFIGVTARCDITGPTATFYLFWANTNFYYLQKLVNGASTALAGPVAGGVSVEDVIRIECEGTTIRCKNNGTTVITVTDSAIATGAPGIGTFFTNPSFRLDDWSGGALLTEMDGFDAMRSNPQTSKLYMVIQQPQYTTDGSTWTGYEWSCRINGANTDDPEASLTVDGGSAATDLLDGQTVLIGSAYGEWDSAVCYVRGDQTVGPATTSLDISTSSEIRGHVSDDDYLVVLDEFRFRQRYGRIEVVGGEIVWYKDYDLEWSDLGAGAAARRLAMMPPVPNMQSHAVKFVEIGDNSASFHWDWSDSYATAPAEVIDDWTAAGRVDFAGNAWVSAAEEPGWKMVNVISGLRGLRTVLQVDDGNGNAATLPYRRGIRYVFTLRRPGETQVGDPPNAEPLVDFELSEPVSGNFQQGYWRTSVTVFEGEASKYDIMPEALVILFTEDRYTNTDDTPFNGSVGPVEDRENILLVGRIVGDTIRENPETGDVSFDVLSPGAEANLYHNYPIVIQNDDAGTTWIDTPDLTVDRAVHYYTTWHTNLNQIADLLQTDDTIEIYAQDFLEGDIYSTLNQFLWDRLFARLLCDKYGRFHAEIDAQEQAFGSVDTLFTLATDDWLEEVNVRQNLQVPVNATECGGLIYTAGNDPPVTPKLSRAPGLFDKYRGTRDSATALAITGQNALNTTCGRHLSALNHEHEADISLAGNWRYCDIAPQEAVDMNSLATERGTLTGDYIIRAVSNAFDPTTGTIFTSIQVEEEADDGVPGVTIPIPDEMPDPDYDPGVPGGFGGGVVPIGEVPGEPPGVPGNHQFYTIRAGDANDYWTDDITASPPVWNLLNHSNQKNKTTVMMSATTNKFFGYGYGIWEYTPLPFDTGAWGAKYTEAQLATLFGHGATYNECYVFKMQFSVRPEQEEWAWAGIYIWYTDGGGDEHIVLGCLHTRDAWSNVVYVTEIADWEEAVDFTSDISICYENGLALDMHSNTCYIVIGKGPEDDGGGNPTFDGWWRLYRSQNFGFSFALAQEQRFTWGVEGYDVDRTDMYADVWVPWVNNTYNGGAVFWTLTTLQEADVVANHDFVPLIYRSLNHGLSYEDIGDDGGDLDHGLNILLGPWNSMHRVYGALATEDAAAGDNRTIYTWKAGQTWTEFNQSAGGADQTRAAVVISQDGLALETWLGLIEPYWVTDSALTDKQRPNDDTFDITWVP